MSPSHRENEGQMGTLGVGCFVLINFLTSLILARQKIRFVRFQEAFLRGLASLDNIQTM